MLPRENFLVQVLAMMTKREAGIFGKTSKKKNQKGFVFLQGTNGSKRFFFFLPVVSFPATATYYGWGFRPFYLHVRVISLHILYIIRQSRSTLQF